MKTRHRKWIYSSILAVTCFVVLYVIYGPIVTSPNRYVLSEDGEAIRSYYVFQSHLQDDNHWIDFQGMNYPFGEHLTYCDSQPANALLFKGLCKIFPALKNYGVGWMNCWSLYGIIFSALLLFWLALDLRISYLFAFGLAFSLVLISPQIVRMKWQPALATNFFVPLCLLLNYRFLMKRSLRWKILLGLNGVFWFFIHPYLGLIAVLFSATILLIYWLKKQNTWKKTALELAVLVALPVVLFQLFLWTTDTHVNRVDSPFGLIKFSSHFDTAFFSLYSPLTPFYQWISGLTEPQMYDHMESWAYIGLAGNIFLLFLLIRWAIKRIFRKKWETPIPSKFQILLIAAAVLFVFSFGIPYKLVPKTVEWVQSIPGLNQFRSLGRFAWIFVYVLFFCLVLYLDYWRKKGNAPWQKQAAVFLFALVIGCTTLEGVWLNQEAANQAKTPNKLYSEASLTPAINKLLKAIEPHHYQAIVPLPYYHIGSHRFYPKTGAPFSFITESMVFAYHTRLPLTSCFFSRNSIEESVASFRFFADPANKSDIGLYFNNKPLLVLQKTNIPLAPEEAQLTHKGKLLLEVEHLALYELLPEDFFLNTQTTFLREMKASISNYVQQGSLYIQKGKKAKKIHTAGKSQGFIGNGNAFAANDRVLFFNSTTDAADLPTGSYRLSFWINHQFNPKLWQLKQKTYSDATEEVNWIHSAKKGYHVTDEWMRYELNFPIQQNAEVQLYFERVGEKTVDSIYMDEFLIQEIESSVLDSIGPDKWSWNNVLLFEP